MRVRGVDRRIQRREQRDQWSDLHEQRGWQLKRGQFRRRAFRFTARQAQPFASYKRLDDRDVPRARPHERIADGELGPDVTLGVRGAMNGAVGAESKGVAECACIALVSLHPRRARGVHRREARIGDDDSVAQRLQVPRDPLALRRGLEENARRRPVAEHRRESGPRRDDALFDEFSVRGQRAEPTLAFVEINPYRIHGAAGLPVELMRL